MAYRSPTLYPPILSYQKGRIRLKIHLLYKDPSLATKLTEQFRHWPGIRKVSANIYTATLLIHFNPQKLKVLNLIESLKNLISSDTIEQHANIMSAPSREFPSHQPKTTTFPTSTRDETHLMGLPQLSHLLHTNLQSGLTKEQAQERLIKFGANDFPTPARPGFIQLFMQEMNSLFIKILLGACGASILLGQFTDALAILIIVLLESALGVQQNLQAEKALDSLKDYTNTQTRVIRQGQIQFLPSKELVVGDIIQIEMGELIPADARIIVSNNLEINEAPLTGESLPLAKSHKITYTNPTPIAEQKNMLFMGTYVVKGKATALVVKTGRETQMGQIAQLIEKDGIKATPLQRDLDQLARIITWISLGICSGITLIGSMNGQPFLEMLRTGVSLAIGAIPEGLTTIMTISLASGVKRMAKKGAIVRKLPAVEALSCVDVICTDKTGTLTTGQMTVTDIFTLDGSYSVTGKGDSAQGQILYQKKPVIDIPKNLQELITCAALCNNSTLLQNDQQTTSNQTSPTEKALLVLAAKTDIDPQELDCYQRIDEIPFASEDRKMTVLCEHPEHGYSIFQKGAPDIILSQCNEVYSGSEIKKITPQDQKNILKKVDQLSNQARRVLGFAVKYTSLKPKLSKDFQEKMVFLGLIGIIDPPKEGVINALKRCQKAGIRVVMITGDHKKTAAAVAREIYLHHSDQRIVTGTELSELSDPRLLEEIDNIGIFARVAPKQKVRIVKALQKQGHHVVMTGDGINDAPAIKHADIGIAMGKRGTTVTRESSAIILTDDDFSTIVQAIEEGRGVRSNIRKFLRYVLSGNMGEVITITIATVLGLPTPFIAGQILLVNLITEGIPALSLGLDPADPRVMHRQPEKAESSIFDRELTAQILSRGSLIGLSSFGFFTTSYLFTGNLTRARTLAYANLVTNQMFHVFDCRRNSIQQNHQLIPAVTISSLLLVCSIYLPSLSRLFNTTPLSLGEWETILLTAGLIGRLDYFKEKATRLVSRRLQNKEKNLLLPAPQKPLIVE